MKIKNILIATVGVLIWGLGAQAYATSYNFSFSDGTVTAAGTLQVSGGVATSGTITTLTGFGGGNPGDWSLFNLGAFNGQVRTADGTDLFVMDNAVPLTVNPSFAGNGGLAFVSGITDLGGPTAIERAAYAFVIYGDGAGGAGLFGSGVGNATTGHVYYGPTNGGTFTLTPAVPDGGMTLTLLGTALTGLAAVRRKLRA
jgi:hypothetical protein